MSLLTIYDAFSEVSITTASKSVGVKDLHELPNSVAAADTPVRLLLPFSGQFAAEDDGWGVYGFGANRGVSIEWKIVDLMLWTPYQSGRGIIDHAEALTEYRDDYIEMLRTGIEAAASWDKNCFAVQEARLRPGVFEWPLESDQWFYGVLAIVTVIAFF